jgi:hypothetical protein
MLSNARYAGSVQMLPLIPQAYAWGYLLECTGEMLYEIDRGHGLHICGEQLAFPALA